MDKLLERWDMIPSAWGFETVTATVLFVVGSLVLRRRVVAAEVPKSIRGVAWFVIFGYLIGVACLYLAGIMSLFWWPAAPLIVAAIGLAAHTILQRRGAGRQAGDMPRRRRTWTTFGARAAFAATTTLVVVLSIVTVSAGAASSPDEAGNFVFYEFGSGVTTFFGWAYGVPVLIGMVLLSAAVIMSLQRSAAPPFRGGVDVAAETRARTDSANGVLALAAAALALTLGVALRMIAMAGHSGGATFVPGVGGFAASPGFADFATAFDWVGFACEVCALVTLAAIGTGTLPRGRRTSIIPAAPASPVGSVGP